MCRPILFFRNPPSDVLIVSFYFVIKRDPKNAARNHSDSISCGRHVEIFNILIWVCLYYVFLWVGWLCIEGTAEKAFDTTLAVEMLKNIQNLDSLYFEIIGMYQISSEILYNLKIWIKWCNGKKYDFILEKKIEQEVFFSYKIIPTVVKHLIWISIFIINHFRIYISEFYVKNNTLHVEI